MLTHPFSLLRQFSDFLDLKFLTKEDDCSSDKDIAQSIGTNKLVSLHQMHGNSAVKVMEPSSRIIQADGLATDAAGLTLTIRFADCQNLVIVAPKKRMIALVHAGWRGMGSRIISSTFSLLRREWDSDPQDTWVGLGPSLCVRCAEFSAPESEAPALTAFIRGRSIDLQAASDHELDLLGVPRSQRERLPDCTRCHPEKYFTYRGGDREKVSAGYTNCFAAIVRMRSK